MPDAYTIDINHAPSAEEQAAAQNGWLWAYNVAQTGDDAYTPLVISLRDDKGNVVGGLIGSYLWGWLKIESFSMEPSLRGRGFGTRLLLAAENDARGRGCLNIWVDTYSFQARPFYERFGYEVFGELGDYPPGHTLYFMRKRLESTPK
jgi:GNAT superfamily N-acetyltransferase